MRRFRFRHLQRAAAACALAALASCTASRWYEHRFQPAPLEVQVSSESVPGTQVRSLVTVMGIERGKDGKPDAAIVRMRLENLGSVPALLDAPSSSLLSADLKAFAAPALATSASTEIPPGGTGEFDLEFPLPEGTRPYQLDLSGLNLRFTLAFLDKRVTTGMTFSRVDWRYYDPGPRVHVGVGMGWYHWD